MRNDDFLVFKARHLRTIFNYRNFEVYELL
jgi:hypothetical protein